MNQRPIHLVDTDTLRRRRRSGKSSGNDDDPKKTVHTMTLEL
jgi:hypothetical protein